MGYDEEEIYNASISIINEQLRDNNPITDIKQLVTYLPCSRSTFYKLFPEGSDKLDKIRELIEDNKVRVKADMRKRWIVSDNATLNLAAYRLLADADEHKRLAQNYVDHTTDGEKINQVVFQLPDDGRNG